ncbi:MAG TPA: DUF2189 domain-containing protein [Rhodoblastus sp.]|nr:DUF2189 domain-containing protein [Rhodoblastus sp.]
MSTFHVYARGEHARGVTSVGAISVGDVRAAVVAGWRDFLTMRSDLALVGLIYPVLGLALALWSSGFNVLYLAYPMMAGFALVGPVAAIGLYEISRRREAGETARAGDAMRVLHSPALASIIALGIILALVFVAWLATAQALYVWLIGPRAPASLAQLVADIENSGHGWELAILGNATGFIFAAVVYCTTVIAFPLMLDRDVGMAEAVLVSVEAVLRNPVPMAVWAVTIAIALALGFATLLVGLAVIMPVLGHASWRLYRALVPART